MVGNVPTARVVALQITKCAHIVPHPFRDALAVVAYATHIILIALIARAAFRIAPIALVLPVMAIMSAVDVDTRCLVSVDI